MSSTTTKPVYSHYHHDDPGYYANNAEKNFIIIKDITPIVIQALGAVTESGKSLYTMCDYGTADGTISMFFMEKMIDSIRKKSPKAQIQIFYEDLPNNDFKSIFLRTNGLLQDQHAHFCLKDYEGVFISAVGCGFYDQCFPDHTIDFGLSTLAMMVLSKRPCPLTGTFAHVLATVEEEKNKWKAQAAKDWETLLLHRAKELVPGGQMLISCLSSDNDWSDYALHKQFDSILSILQLQGDITPEELHDVNMVSYFRTEEEFKEPFNNPESSVSKSGLSLKYFEMKVYSCPIRKWYIAQKDKGDPKLYAARLSASIRRWLNHTIFDGLSEARTVEERIGIVNKFFTILEADIERSPEKFFLDDQLANLHISKKA